MTTNDLSELLQSPGDMKDYTAVHDWMSRIHSRGAVLDVEENLAENYGDILGKFGGGFDHDASTADKKQYMETFTRYALGKCAGVEMPEGESPLIDSFLRGSIINAASQVMFEEMRSNDALSKWYQNRAKAVGQENAIAEYVDTQHFGKAQWIKFASNMLDSMPETYIGQVRRKAWDEFYGAHDTREEAQEALFDEHFDKTGAAKFPGYNFKDVESIVDDYVAAEQMRMPAAMDPRENHRLGYRLTGS